MRALLIAESWGVNEKQYRHALVGRSGQELARMGGEAGLFPHLIVQCRNCHQNSVFGRCPCGQFNPVSFLEMVKFWAKTRNHGVGVTNVFYEHPERDNEELFFGSRSDDVCLDIPPLKKGSKNLYLLRKHRHHYDALETEIQTLQPNVLVPLGNTACWAVLHQTYISKIRGTVTETRFGIKAIPTYHPAALRDWSLRGTIISDLRKATKESQTSGITRPSAWILTSPTMDEIETWFAKSPKDKRAVDIESGVVLYSKAEIKRIRERTPKSFSILARLISMVGFASSEDQALVIPFLKRSEENGSLESYWPTKAQEVRAWEWVQYGLSSGAELIAQNGMYDYNRLLCCGMRPRNMVHDTMLAWHALYPELPKSLGFLDSILRNDSAWKTMYGNESLKRDD